MRRLTRSALATLTAPALAGALSACESEGAVGDDAGAAGGTAAAGGGDGGAAGPAMACGTDPRLAEVLTLPNEGNAHVPPGTAVTYGHAPPASGPHYGVWGASGVYTEAVDPRTFVHNLEHGWVVLLYRPDASAEQVDVLRAFHDDPPADPFCPDGGPPRVIVSPAPGLSTEVAAVAWTHVLARDALDRPTLAAFFRDCRGAAPELRVCADGREPAFLP